MDKVLISNAQGESGIVNVVRYFANNGKEFLIYSLNEVDEAGYTRLYVVKLSGVDGVYNGDTLSDSEWAEIREQVKMIVKANKEGLPVPVQDLNPKKINNIILKDKKVFKLTSPLVVDLSNNKTNFENDINVQTKENNLFEMPTNMSTFDAPVQPTFDIPNQSTIESNNQSIFNNSQQSSFETPVQPTFDIPSQPTFDIPSQSPIESNNQSMFDVPQQPTFEMPNQPTFETSNQSVFDTPMQSSFDNINQPSFGNMNQSSFEMPSTPEYNQSNSQMFENNTQSTFGNNDSSMFEFQNTSAFDMNVQPKFESQATIDYEKLYNEEVEKNQKIQAQIDELNQEVEKYKNIISTVKNIIEK